MTSGRRRAAAWVGEMPATGTVVEHVFLPGRYTVTGRKAEGRDRGYSVRVVGSDGRVHHFRAARLRLADAPEDAA